MENKAAGVSARKVLAKMQNFTNGVTKSTELDILFDEAENFLRKNNFFSAAYNYKMILAIYAKEKKGPLDSASIHRKLGFLYREVGMYSESIEHLRKALALYQKVPENDKIAQICEIHLELGETLLKEDRFPEAHEILEKALTIIEEQNSTCSLLKLKIYEKLGESRVAVKQYEEGFNLLKMALDITFKVNEYEGEIPNIFFSMGKAHSRKGNIEEALHYFKKVLQIFEKEGIRDKRLAEIYEELSYIHLKMDRFEEADISLLRALRIKEELYKESHVEIARTYITMSSLYFYQNLIEESLTNIDHAIKILEDFYGKYHYELVKAYRSRSLIYVASKEYNKALQDMENAISITKRLHGENYFLVGELYVELGNIYLTMKNFKLALKQYRAGSKLLKMWRGLGHPSVAEAYAKTCKTCLVMGKVTKAEMKYRRIAEGLLISLETSIGDTMENFPFAKVFKLYDIHPPVLKAFDHLSSKVKKLREKLIKTAEDKKNFIGLVKTVFEKYHRKPREQKKVLGWLGIQDERPTTPSVSSLNNI
jgi:Tetratricopeptide repeat./Uncharacterized protein conserved in bacteria (DUF2225).